MDGKPLCTLTLKFTTRLDVDKYQVAAFERGLEKLAGLYLKDVSPAPVVDIIPGPEDCSDGALVVATIIAEGVRYREGAVTEYATIIAMHEMARHLQDLIILPIPHPCLWNIDVADKYGNQMTYAAGRGEAE